MYYLSFQPKRRGAAVRSAPALLCLGLLCGFTALALRYPQASIHAFATLLLGADNRNLLEHFLAGLAVPLCALTSLLAAAGNARPRPDASWRLRLRVLWPVAAAAIAAAEWTGRHAYVLLPCLYLSSCVDFELGQAWHAVNGGPARGHVQYSQLFADGIGALSAGLLARRACRGD